MGKIASSMYYSSHRSDRWNIWFQAQLIILFIGTISPFSQVQYPEREIELNSKLLPSWFDTKQLFSVESETTILWMLSFLPIATADKYVMFENIDDLANFYFSSQICLTVDFSVAHGLTDHDNFSSMECTCCGTSSSEVECIEIISNIISF